MQRHSFFRKWPPLYCSIDCVLLFFHTGVFLHVLADTLGSVGVIISAGLIYQFGKLWKSKSELFPDLLKKMPKLQKFANVWLTY